MQEFPGLKPDYFGDIKSFSKKDKHFIIKQINKKVMKNRKLKKWKNWLEEKVDIY